MQTIEQKLEYKRKYNAERAEFLKSLNLCVWCGKEKALENRRLCYDCMMKSSENHSAYWRRLSPEQKQSIYERRKEVNRARRQYRRDNGLCTRCGQKALQGRAMCVSCTLKNRQSGKEHSRKIGRITFEERGNGVYCQMCCEKVENEGSKYCNSCYEKAVEKAAHMRTFVKKLNPVWRADNQRVFQKGK